jgi:hypothetical protein
MLELGLFGLSTLLLSRMRMLVQQRIQGLTALAGGSKRSGIYLYSIIFLPGIILHELSHFFAAGLLGVPTGDIDILPRFSDEAESNRVALGKVHIAKTDFVRSSIIGAAPFIFGCLGLYTVVLLSFPELIKAGSGPELVNAIMAMNEQLTDWKSILWLYLTFSIGNTMFVSKEDTQAWPVLVVLVVILVGLAVFTGHIDWWSDSVLPFLRGLARALLVSFWVSMTVTWVISAWLWLIQKALEQLTGKKLVYH